MLRTLVCGAVVGLASVAVAQTDESVPMNWAELVEQGASLIEDRFAETGELERARSAANELLDSLIYHASYEPDRKGFITPAWTRAAVLKAMLDLAAEVDNRELHRFTSVDVIGLAKEAPEATAALVSTIDREHDRVWNAYVLMSELVALSPEMSAEFADLIAAIAVTRDTGRADPMIELEVDDPATPHEVYGYFATRPQELQLDVRTLPPELLVYVVDVAASVDDLWWARSKHGRLTLAGKTYHDIAYDYDSFLQGKPLKVTQAPGPFSLMKLRQQGGVCRHQAYYAAHVGKAMGVPTAYSRASGISVGHAWPGYLRRGVRGRWEWDFSEGRWSDYENTRGETISPHTGRVLGDDEISLTGDLLGLDREARLFAFALLTASRRVKELERARGVALAQIEAMKPHFVAAEELEKVGGRPALRRRLLARAGLLETPREIAAWTRFELLEQSLRQVPAWDPGWSQLEGWSADLDDEGRQYWFEVSDRLVGRRFPDVQRRIVRALLGEIEDLAERDLAWMWLEGRMRSHPTYLADTAIGRGRDMVAGGYQDAAWKLWYDTAMRIARESPMTVELLFEMEKVAIEQPDSARFLANAYRDVYRRTPQPDSMAPGYTRWSAKYRLGNRFADWLTSAGRTSEAQQVRTELRNLLGEVR